MSKTFREIDTMIAKEIKRLYISSDMHYVSLG